MFATYAMLLPLTQFGNCSGEPFPKGGLLRSGSYCGAALHRWYLMVPASAQLRVRPERKDGGHPALCNAPPQWLRMRHQSHQSHQVTDHSRTMHRPLHHTTATNPTTRTSLTSTPLPLLTLHCRQALALPLANSPSPHTLPHLTMLPPCNAPHPSTLPCLPPMQCCTLTQFGNCSGEPFPKGGLLRSGSYCGAALHRRYLMVPASAQLRVRPERKDGGHPALCNAPPQWLRMRHQSHQSH